MKAGKIIAAVEGVTGRWAKQRKREERARSAEANRYRAMTRQSSIITIREAAFTSMEEAYLKASAQGTLPALARQIMYAARPLVQDYSTRELGSGFDRYFTQTLLPDYMAEHLGSTADWDVVFDARGNFTEPHTGQNVPLGTIDVRDYLARIAAHAVGPPEFEVREKLFPTLGPKTSDSPSAVTARAVAADRRGLRDRRRARHHGVRVGTAI